MNRLHRKVEYALMALQLLRQQSSGELLTARQMSITLGVPFDVLSRVLQKMGKEGWVKSVQGASGGYYLSVDLKTVSFFDILQRILGSYGVVKCLDQQGCELRKRCQVQMPLSRFNERLMDFYKSLSVEELLEERSIQRSVV